MQRLIFDQGFALPPEQVFDYFAEHENLQDLLGAEITRLKDGTDGNRNGVGSCRQLKVGPFPPFEETTTVYESPDLIEYEITKGSPLKNHHGSMRFTAEAGGTNLHYEITFGSKVPGLDILVAQGLKKNIAKGLAKAPGAR